MNTGSSSLSLPGGRRLPGAALLLAVLALTVHLVPGINELLEYRREAIVAGQLWRLLSCHWAHFSLNHLSWDLLAFLFLGSAAEQRSRPRFLLTVFGSAVLVSAVVWFLIPGMAVYRGLSGIGSALLGLLVVQLIRDALRQKTPLVLIFPGAIVLLFLGKIGYELWFGTSVFVSDYGATVSPVPLAHLVGAAVGSAVALVRWPRNHLKKVPTRSRSWLREAGLTASSTAK